MSDEPVCNFCGSQDPETWKEVGTHRGESGAIGLGICGVCMDAVEWHEKHSGSTCAICGETARKRLQIATPFEPHSPQSGWSVEVALCRDCNCNAGGMMHMWESDLRFRARANVLYDWDRQRRFVLHRDGLTCKDCGVSDCRLHVHHINPRSEGGTNHRDNLVSLCPDCHARRHGKDACLLCGSLTDSGATWADTSGGVWAAFCAECAKYIRKNGTSKRCSICARFGDSKRSDGIFWTPKVEDDGKVDVYSACDECRSNLLLSNNWKQRFEYIEKTLPDSHVDVAHWERGDLE